MTVNSVNRPSSRWVSFQGNQVLVNLRSDEDIFEGQNKFNEKSTTDTFVCLGLDPTAFSTPSRVCLV